MLVSLSRTTPAISSAMLGQSSRDTEVADRMMTQALLHPVDKTVDEDLFQSGIRRRWRTCAHGCERTVAAGHRPFRVSPSMLHLASKESLRVRIEARIVFSVCARRRARHF